MPELPEVETIRIGLSTLLPGLAVRAVDVGNAKSFPNEPSVTGTYLIGAYIVGVRRRAKVLLIELSTAYSLVIHLKMTGQLVFVGPRTDKGEVRFGAGHPSNSLVGALPDRSTRVVVTFTSGAKLFFNDQRKFGWMRLIPTSEVPTIDFFKTVGPEPLEPTFTWQLFRERLWRRQKRAIKAALLDQTIVAGVGNIYADESLWAAKIHPETRVGELSDAAVRRLHTALIAVLQLSISMGGSTDRNYVDVHGRKGSYLQFANVFRREGQDCPRCGTRIIKMRVAGRGTHICPTCQRKAR